MQSVEIWRAVNSQDVAGKAANLVLDRIKQTKAEINIALTGGTVGILTLKQLSVLAKNESVDWSKVQFWFGDERYVSQDSPDRNFNQAFDALLGTISIPEVNLHQFPSSSSGLDLEAARLLFEQHLIEFFDSKPPKMDLTLLGMGPDGHVASIFPGHNYPETQIVSEADSPKPPAQRLSFSLELINRSEEVVFVVSGIDKAEAIELVHKDPECELPAARVQAEGLTLWIVDEAAGAAFWSC
jgi:6-phosphogluconolactonase